MDYQSNKLDGGITLLKVPIKDSESVVVNFFIKTGSRNEVEKLRGISHFLEHLLFKGTKKYPNAKILSTTVESIGAEYNAATSKEYTLFYIKAAAEHLRLIFDVLSDMVFHPRLDPAEIEREKGVIVEEMNMYRDTPMRFVPDLLEELMWPGTDLGAQIIGDEKTVNGIFRQDILGYLGSQYVNKNLIVAVGGNYKEKELNRLVAEYCGTGVSGVRSSWRSPLRGAKKSNVKLQFKKTEQAHLALGFYGFDFNDRRNPAVDVLCNLLGGGMSSRLFTEIRERRGLAYYVHMSSNNYQDTGLISLNAGLRLGKVEEAISVAASELRKIKVAKIDPKELKKAKDNLVGRVVLSLEDSESRLNWYLEQLAFCNEILRPKEYFKRIQQVTASQLQKMANEIFQTDKARLALIGPYRQESAYKKLLKF